MASPFAYAIPVGIVIALIRPPLVFQIILLAMVPYVPIVIWIRRRTGWPGFIPGVLTTVILLPVGFLALCGIILMNAGGHF
jgi:hypothetical protein